MKTTEKGFTLVELMITVAIIGILAAIVMPVYQDYVTRGRIPDATSALASKRVQLEQYFQDNGTYVGGCTTDTASSQYFDFSCPAAPTATTFTIRAQGKGAMLGFTYTIDQNNTKATTALPVGWGPTNGACWVTKKGGVC